jgi:ribosomal protein S18 acetylase RimI-like enzyme
VKGALRVRPARRSDVVRIAKVGSVSFSGLRPLRNGRRWVSACFAAYPRLRYWVAEEGRDLLGYILWMEKGGFRQESVWELEQIAVSPSARGRGVGGRLITVSLAGLKRSLDRRGARLKLVEVTTGSEQHAVEFYRRTLNTKVVAKIPDLFRGDEYLLVARFVKTAARE